MADNVPIKGIEFQVKGDADKAAESLNRMATALNALKRASTGKKNALKETTEEIKESGEEAVEAESRIVRFKEAFKKLRGETDKDGKSPSLFKNILSQTRTVFGVVGKISKLGFNVVSSPFKIVDVATEKLKSFGDVIGNTRLFRPIYGVIKGLNSFTRAIGRIALYRAIRTLIKEITQGFKEGIDNLSSYSRLMNGTFHQSMDSLATDAQYLKNSLATIAEPLISQIAPVIDLLTDKVASLLNMLSQLFARLNGQSTYTRAVKSATEYGDSVTKAAKAAKAFSLGIDELNVFDPTNSNSKVSASEFKEMFETATIDSQIASFADRLKAAITEGDFKGVGTILAEKVNGFISSIGWKSIGDKIGTFLNGAFETAVSFMRTTNFGNIGGALIDALNGVMEKIDFTNLGALFIRKFTLWLDLIIGGVKQLDWSLLGKSLSDYLSGVFTELGTWIASYDWGEVVTSIGDGLADFIRGAELGKVLKSIAYVASSIIAQIPSILVAGIAGISDMVSSIFADLGLDSVAGFFSGISEKLKTAATWLKEHFVDPVVGWVKNLLGIHSPSTVFAEIGVQVIEGLYLGISQTWAKIVSFFTTAFANLKTAFSTTWNNIQNTVSTVWNSIKNTTKTVWDSITSNLSSIWNGLKGSASQTWDNMKSHLSTAWSDMKSLSITIWSGIFTALSNTWSSMVSTATVLWNGLKSAILGIFSDIHNGLESKWNDLKEWWSKLELPSFKVKMPHLSWYTEPARGWVSDILSALGMPTSIPKLHVEWYAKGGFPDMGQLFVARENGAELVGDIGGRTGVANNEQIIKGIAQGVAGANVDVVAALYEVLDTIERKNFEVNIGDDAIGRSYDRYNSNRGIRVSKGAFANAY